MPRCVGLRSCRCYVGSGAIGAWLCVCINLGLWQEQPGTDCYCFLRRVGGRWHGERSVRFHWTEGVPQVCASSLLEVTDLLPLTSPPTAPPNRPPHQPPRPPPPQQPPPPPLSPPPEAPPQNPKAAGLQTSGGLRWSWAMLLDAMVGGAALACLAFLLWRVCRVRRRRRGRTAPGPQPAGSKATLLAEICWRPTSQLTLAQRR